MKTSAGQLGNVFEREDMGEPCSLAFGAGQAVVFSTPAPDLDHANEDAAGIFPINDTCGVLAVADGLGGQPAGESASRIALDCLRQSLERAAGEDSIRGAILDGLERANQEVRGLGIGAATTLAAVEIRLETLRAYHVGDSAVLVVGQRGKMKLETIRHSPVGYAVESGLLDAEEAMHHDDRHLISNAVGASDMRIEIGSHLHLAPRDTVLLATDGLLDNLTPPEVVEILRVGPLATVAGELARRASERMRAPRNGLPSKPDDCTFILFRLDPRQRGQSVES